MSFNLDDIPTAAEVQAEAQQNEIRATSEMTEAAKMRQNIQEMFIQQYMKVMIDAIKYSINHLKWTNKKFTNLRVDFNSQLAFDENHSRSFHSIHYGFINKQSWSNRTLYVPPKEMPFRVIQRLMLEKGFYVLDESDGSKSFTPCIRIYVEPPADLKQRQKLWHKMNVLL